MKWISMFGRFDPLRDGLIFRGGYVEVPGGEPRVEVGNFISDQYYGGGHISAKIEFKNSTEGAAGGLILYYHPQTQGFVSAHLGGYALASVNTLAGQDWTRHAAHGPSEQLEANCPYKFEVSMMGSEVVVSIDGVRVLSTNLPFPLPRGQAGIWAMGPNDIHVKQFAITSLKPRIFVIMQFTPPFNELYAEVIQPIGQELGFDVVRADETYGPGIIIADIERQIVEATAVIADITPQNPNVYWEVGYSYALRKPTILIAQSDTELPFDVSPFRTLFYEDTIAGKTRVEEGLRKHIEAIQSLWKAL